MNMRKIPVILDADTGIDDTMALLICATSSKLDVLAAVSTFGNTTIDYATQNTMDVLALCGRQDIAVGMGADRPWKKKLRTSPYIHGVNGIGEYQMPEHHREALSPLPAWDLAYEKIMACPEKVTYVALGSLTNVANLFCKHPDVKPRLDKVVYMGCELRGNVAGSQCASVNIFHDPDAAKYAIEGGVPFHICTSSQVTDHVKVTMRELEARFGGDDWRDRMILELFRYYFGTTGGYDDPVEPRVSLHDPSTVMYLIEPQYFTGRRCYCGIETAGIETYGYSLIDIYNLEEWPESEFNIVLVGLREDTIPALQKATMDGLEAAIHQTC